MKTMIWAIAATVLSAASAAADVTVSSKIDTEGGFLGNIILLALEDAGVPVTNRLQLGGTPIVREAIVSGQIDIYPEYTGNAAFFFNEGDSDVWKDAAQGYAGAAELDLETNNLVWLEPSPANNTWAIALRGDLAEANELTTMSEMGAWIAGGGSIKLAASSEFVTSPVALPAFQTVYGFTLAPEQLITLSGGDTAATIAAAAQGTSGANAAMVYGTDGAISAAGLVVMEDDAGVQPVYAPTPVIRAEVLEEYPQIADILNPIFAGLTLEVLQEHNGRIQVGGEPAAEVARDYLTQTGVLD